MAFPTTLGTMRDYVESLYREDANFPALTDSEKNDLINDALIRWTSEVNPAIRFVSGLSMGISYTQAGSGRATAGVTTIAEILACHATSAALDATGVPMEKIELHEMIALQLADATQSATPTRWASNRVYGTQKWQVWIHPLSNGTARVGLAIRDTPRVMSADGNTPNVTPEEIDYICRLAAWDAARLAGRSPDFMATIIAPVPDKAAVLARKTMPLVKPHERMVEEPV